MILLLLRDGQTLEVYDCEDVIHKPGYLICMDYSGAPITTFAAHDIAGYTLNPHIARALLDQAPIENPPVRFDSTILEKWWNDDGLGGNSDSNQAGDALLAP